MFVAKRNIPRAGSLEEIGSRVRLYSRTLFEEAVKKHWDFDAHFFPYFVESDEEYCIPAQKKFLSTVRKKADNFLAQDFLIDFDLKNHKKWEHLHEVESVLSDFSLALQLAQIPDPTWVYSTLHGFRAVWSLQKPLPVDEWEMYLQAFLVALEPVSAALTDLHLDLSCADWTRCYRLPFVTRDNGMQTWKEDWSLLLGPGETLNLEDLKKVCNNFLGKFSLKNKGQKEEDLEIEEIEDPQPTEEEVFRTLTNQDGLIHPEVVKIISKFKGQSIFPYLYYGHIRGRHKASLPVVGKRYPFLKRATGMLVGYLMAWFPDEATPQLAYALLYHLTKAMRIQGFEKDPPELLWDLIKFAWKREAARVKKTQEEEEDYLTQLVHRVEKWNTLPEFTTKSLGEKKEWILSHLMLLHSASDRVSFLHAETGQYTAPVFKFSKIQIRNQLLAMGTARFVEFTKPVGEKEVPVSLEDIYIQHGKILLEFRVNSTIPTCQLEIKEGGYILSIPPDREPDLPAEYNQDVDRWLRTFIPPLLWKSFCQWLKGAKRFDHPLSALALLGASSAGKSMLARAIGQYLGFGIFADESVLKDWTGQLRNTAYVVLEEGLSKSINRTGEYAKRFKSLLSGTPILGNEKYGMQFSLTCLARIVICANEPEEVLEGLFESSRLRKNNRKAINDRFLIITISDEAFKFLEERGHWKLTQDWIDKKILAKHLQYLADSVDYVKDKRFQVEIPEQMMELQEEFLEEEVGNNEEFVLAVMDALQFYAKTGHPKIKFANSTICLTVTVLDEYFTKTKYGRRWSNLRQISKALKEICSK